ncbi:glycosyltransferase family A protein [Nocardioides sp. 616]|uniref:glycosyltransferase family 2 protein n=1 Tax=Nocardioides sp. 616 TaxID=2268090 RepID=UPI000CE2CD2F|nr:glycosyltransferase family A protein [Nocardioides sp. 616]
MSPLHPGHEAALPDVDVVVATRNRPDLLARALAAIADQDYAGVVRTWVVFDQCPVDTSVTRDDVRRPVTALDNPRAPGLAGARNSGVLAGSAPLVGFCDDDDEWLPTKITAQVHELELTGAPTSVTGIVVVYRDSQTSRVATRDELTLANLVRHRVMAAHPSTVVVRREALLGGIGLVDEEIPGSHGEDYDWIIRAARHGSFAVVEQPLVRVQWGQSMFSQRWPTIVAATDYWLAKHPEFHADSQALGRLQGQRAFALAAMRSPGARSAIMETMRTRPRELRAWLAAAVALRVVSAERLMDLAHRNGRGI